MEEAAAEDAAALTTAKSASGLATGA